MTPERNSHELGGATHPKASPGSFIARFSSEEGNHFMRHEPKEVVDRVMREYNENQEHINRLAVELSRIGRRLIDLGEALAGNPEGVHLTAGGVDIKYSSDLDVAKLASLTNDYRNALQTRAHLEDQLRQLGIPPPRDTY